MKITKWIWIVSCLLLLFLTFPQNSSEAKEIQVYVDSVQQHYDQHPMIMNGYTMVPFRAIFEAFNAKVEWNSAERKVVAETENQQIILPIHSSTAIIDDNLATLEQPAILINERTLVPLRFVSESLGAYVSWNSETQTINIETSHEKVKSEEKQQVQTKLSVNNLSIGDNEEEVTKRLGMPHTQVTSTYGFQWDIYHEEYKNYVQIGMKNNQVIAIYTSADLFKNSYGIKVGETTDKEVLEILGEPKKSITKGNTNFVFDSKGEWALYLLDDSYITFFYDQLQGGRLQAVQLINRPLEESFKAFYATGTSELRVGYERQLFELTNVTRVRKGISPLNWSEEMSYTARKHSQDMAKYNYFSHVNTKGDTPFERMKEDGFTFRVAGENLAMGQTSAIFALHALMNSEGHSKNILHEQFEELGVGVAFSKDIPYFTQKFFSAE
ncbi:stalk domain-containing protein [Bacillus sp. FJAT-45350]|uniref:stalk domain-containing protein n=1 Tax=Bacillus sp. FJAT-45350 TaxID=2011014 RepID=UPI000BB8EEAC|nr:stalk domain-containing protein [Bacillus sp. FJAT-45350]